nr:immunoglobulin heavy chain junction region [Mus musculus]
NLKNEDTATYF